ncbi:MAG: transcription termination/antitermination protein NusG, partial [Patescibacteria group bacterium]
MSDTDTVTDTANTEEKEAPETASTEAPNEQPALQQDNPDAKWYVIHVQTGYEGRVKAALEQRVMSLGVEDKIFAVVIP